MSDYHSLIDLINSMSRAHYEQENSPLEDGLDTHFVKLTYPQTVVEPEVPLVPNPLSDIDNRNIIA